MGNFDEEDSERVICNFSVRPAAFSQKENKRFLGADLVPAGTLYSPGVLVGDTLYVSGL